MATAYNERDLIGIGYVIEQGTQDAQARHRGQPEHVPLREDGAGTALRRARRLQPGLRDRLMSLVGSVPDLPFSLETESAKGLQERMTAAR